MKRSSSSGPALISKKTKTEVQTSSESTKQPLKKEKKLKYGKKTSPGKKNSKEINIKNNNKEQLTVLTKIKNQTLTESGKLEEGKDKKIKTKFGKKTGIIKKTKVTQNKKGKEESFKELPSNLIGKDGKPQWNKVKDEKKKLKEDRKVRRTGADQYQLSVKAKSLWEKLRRKTLLADKNETLINELFMLLKGQIPNVVHSHDMARVVQWMLKLGTPSVRTSICEDLTADTVSFLQSKHARHCVKRVLTYGSKNDKNNLIQSCNGHFLKLLGHTLAGPVVEKMYSKFASSAQRRQMHREMYGDMHALVAPEVTRIQDIPDNMRPAILAATKTNLTKLLAKKQLLRFTLVQSILNDFLASCSDQDRLEIFELIHEHLLDLLNTKEGTRVALLTVWHATNKMKKVIVKKLMKGKVKEIATSETGHRLLMALFDSMDDTVLVNKVLIPELLTDAEALANDELGRKVILYLVAHRDSAYFHPQQTGILSKGDSISTRKKDDSKRKQEILEAVSGPLLEKITEDPEAWFKESSVAMVSLAIMKSGKGDALQSAFEKVTDYILEPNSMVEMNGRQFHVIEHTAMHLALKKLIKQDQSSRTQETFSMVLASKLSQESLTHLLQFNRGCFLLVLLFESMNKKVCKILRSKIDKSMQSFLRQQETTGSKILLKKLAEHE